jgi:chromosome segregation ATPase
MDTLTIVREIIDLAAERDALRNRLSVANDEIRAFQADSLRLQSRVTTQAALIDELRAALDAKREPIATSAPEQTHMTREEILSVAREALVKGWEVHVLMSDGQTHTAHIREIDDSKLPIRFDDDSCELTWEYLACEADPALEGGIPKVSRLELL